jgi:predicted nucleotide-binding protein
VTNVLDQQFVAHLFAPAGGPRAAAAAQAVREVWRGCEVLFGMSAPVAGTGLPAALPDPGALRAAIEAGGEVALAAQGRPGVTCQALLRLHHDVLSLSVGLAPADAWERPGTLPRTPEERQWWRDLDFQWNLLVERHSAWFLGEARLFLARVDAETGIRSADPDLYSELAALVPPASSAVKPEPRAPRPNTPVGVPFHEGFAVWEVGRWPEDRAARCLMIAIAPDADPAASNWAWSPRRTAAIPPLARYLLHAAKLRYEARVWRRDSQVPLLRESLNALSAEVRRTGDPGAVELLRLRQMDAVLLHADLLAMRRTVEIAADNLRRAVGLFGSGSPGEPEAIPGSLFADDAAVARSLDERLDDEVGYLAIAADRAEKLAALFAPQAQPTAAGARQARVPSADSAVAVTARPDTERRNVFVVYGRDNEARRAVFDFLRSLGLRPLEWEELVQATGKMAPFLSETVRTGLEMATAVVVLLTPEDVVHLHPDLHEPGENASETSDRLQARPNVLLELGMAMGAKPDATLILLAGEHRTVTDLGGMSYVRLSGDAECRTRIANRLRVAGCAVNPVGTDWLTAGNFGGMAAQSRTPSATVP